LFRISTWLSSIES